MRHGDDHVDHELLPDYANYELFNRFHMDTGEDILFYGRKKAMGPPQPIPTPRLYSCLHRLTCTHVDKKGNFRLESRNEASSLHVTEYAEGLPRRAGADRRGKHRLLQLICMQDIQPLS